MQVKEISKGDGVGYNHLFVAPENLTLAVVAIGYGEGLTQALTGKLTVLIKGREVPVIGQISMNLIAANVTKLGVKRGDEVVIIGSQRDEQGRVSTIKLTDLAKRSGLRHHEIVLRLAQGLPKIYEKN